MTEKERFLHLMEPEEWEAFVLKKILENPTRYPQKKFSPKQPPSAKALPPQKPCRPGRALVDPIANQSIALGYSRF